MAVEMTGITKRFPGVIANDGVDLVVRTGEVHALLGENGAGKTTLMNILYGLLRPDRGTIRIGGAPVLLRSPRDALRHGIGMVHQHFLLVPTMTVADNIVLGREPRRGPLVSPSRARQRLAEFANEFGLTVSPQRRVAELAVGEQQRVEIVKALYHGADVLILDEPTAALTPLEAEALFRVLRTLAGRGKAVIFISHKLKEVLAVSHRITVLRQSRGVGTVVANQTREADLAAMMIGRDLVPADRRGTRPAAPGDGVVRAERVTMGTGAKPQVADVSLEVRAGEILGVAGVDGNGQVQLAEVLAGLQRPDRGRVVIDGETLVAGEGRLPADRGIWHVPADRKADGAVMTLSVAANSVLKHHRWRPFSRRGILDHRAIGEFAEGLVRAYDVRCPSIHVPAGTLSGGNLQKLILARETSRRPRLLIVEHPTRGLDIGATESVREALRRAAEAGAAIVLISADLDEILALSDRLVVMYEGAIVYACPTADVSLVRLGLALAGRAPAPAAPA